MGDVVNVGLTYEAEQVSGGEVGGETNYGYHGFISKVNHFVVERVQFVLELPEEFYYAFA